MKAKWNKGERTIQFTGLPPCVEGISGLPTELTIRLQYSDWKPSPAVCKAITLDNVILPAIEQAVNHYFRHSEGGRHGESTDT